MKANEKKYLTLLAAVASLSFIFIQSALAQNSPNVLTFAAPAGITARPGETAQATLSVTVAPGYHANSNKPVDSYLIPLRLTWNPGPVVAVDVAFPKPRIQKLGFSTKPVSVFTGKFDIVTRFRVAGDAAPGTDTVTGKLHYQACNETTCLTPKTIDVTLPVEIVK